MRSKVIISIIALVLIFYAASRTTTSEPAPYGDAHLMGKMTLEKYNSIETGMTYEKVCEIVGGEGVLTHEVDLGLGLAYEITYQWEGAGVIGANASVTFRYGKVTGKEQAGLQ